MGTTVLVRYCLMDGACHERFDPNLFFWVEPSLTKSVLYLISISSWNSNSNESSSNHAHLRVRTSQCQLKPIAESERPRVTHNLIWANTNSQAYTTDETIKIKKLKTTSKCLGSAVSSTPWSLNCQSVPLNNSAKLKPNHVWEGHMQLLGFRNKTTSSSNYSHGSFYGVRTKHPLPQFYCTRILP